MQLSLKILSIVMGCIVSASITCESQIKLSYEYDASGNRIGRIVTETPSKQVQDKALESSEMFNEIKVTCSPNPTDGIINISIIGVLEDGGFARIFDMSGVLLIEQPLSYAMTFDLAGYDSGIYLVSISNGGNVNTIRVIKK